MSRPGRRRLDLVLYNQLPQLQHETFDGAFDLDGRADLLKALGQRLQCSGIMFVPNRCKCTEKRCAGLCHLRKRNSVFRHQRKQHIHDASGFGQKGLLCLQMPGCPSALVEFPDALLEPLLEAVKPGSVPVPPLADGTLL